MSRDVRSHPPAAPLEPELQQVLGQANVEYGAARDEAAAFRRLALELERRSPERGLSPWLWVCAGVCAAALAVVLLRNQLPPSPVATLRPAPEPPSAAPSRRERARDATGTVTADSELAPEPARESALAPGLRARPRPERAEDAPERAEDAPERGEVQRPRRAPAPLVARGPIARGPVAPAPVAEAREEDCLALAREGRVRPAERCFERRSQGTGLSAEMALYELARLRRDVLGDTEGALGALGDYRQRFPSGSLRNEVEVSRIELLARARRAEEALQASEQLLATPAGRERAAELRLLRGNVYRASGALRAASDEYARAEQLGGSLGEEAAFLQAQCLEALGDVAAARAAYARAAQSEGPRRAEARERLEALQRVQPAQRP